DDAAGADPGLLLPYALPGGVSQADRHHRRGVGVVRQLELRGAGLRGPAGEHGDREGRGRAPLRHEGGDVRPGAGEYTGHRRAVGDDPAAVVRVILDLAGCAIDGELSRAM